MTARIYSHFTDKQLTNEIIIRKINIKYYRDDPLFERSNYTRQPHQILTNLKLHSHANII